MNLTQQEKQDYYHQYENLLWHTVHRFRANTSFHCPREDLFQECVVVLLEHALKAQSMEQLHLIPVRDMVHAMSMYSLGQQALAYPKCTDGRRRLARVLKDQQLPVVQASSYCTEDDLLFELDFSSFVDTLPPVQKRVVSLKRGNYTNREIARSMGVADSSVTFSTQAVRKKYESIRSC